MTPTQALNKCNIDYHANVEGRHITSFRPV